MSGRGRRLGAIMFVDIAGFTAMSSKDEGAALELLKKYGELVKSIFPKYEGRVVKTMGDGHLVEFSSAVEAVDCAVELQERMTQFNAPLADSGKLMIRVGIHVGDVVHTEDDVLGDAVNVASRVEPEAEPGGICVTRQVVDQVEGKVKWRLTRLGQRPLKNLPNPVELFIVSRVPMEAREERPQGRQNRVAILPFSNLSPDPNDRYFVDGITEELISTVSKIGELSVISRASAMRYRDTSLTMKQVGRELGVAAILEGSVRKAGNRIRIAAQLIEVDTDRYVWSQSYDRDLTDVFGVQGEIAEQVAEGLKVQLLSKEKDNLEAKATGSPEAYSLYLKGRFYLNERTEEGAKKAIRYFEEALQNDPTFAKAHSGMADCYLILSDYGWMPPARAGELARANAMKALSLDESLPEAHASLGLTYVNHDWDFAAGERELKRAIELNPNFALAYHWYAIALNFQRKYEEGLGTARKALSLDPFSMVIRQSVGVSLLCVGRHREAVEMFAKVVDENPDLTSVHYYLGMANILQGRWEDAIREARREVEADDFNPGSKLDLAFALAESGAKAEAEKMLDEAIGWKGSYVSPTSIALVALSVGRLADGERYLKKALEDRDSSLLYFMSAPVYLKYASLPEAKEVRDAVDVWGRLAG